ASQYLDMPLEEHVAFLKPEELTLDGLLKRLPIPNRPYALISPRLPPYFGTLDRERRALMIEKCARPGSELARMTQQIWLPLFTPPPPPSYIPQEEFAKSMGQAIEQRFHDVAAAVQKLRSRGGKIVFVRIMPRCPWATLEPNITYHDEEWGVPVHDDRLLFEFLILEGAQAGLSWTTILKKRANYRKAFGGFRAEKIARYGARDMKRLL